MNDATRASSAPETVTITGAPAIGRFSTMSMEMTPDRAIVENVFCAGGCIHVVRLRSMRRSRDPHRSRLGDMRAGGRGVPPCLSTALISVQWRRVRIGWSPQPVGSPQPTLVAMGVISLYRGPMLLCCKDISKAVSTARLRARARGVPSSPRRGFPESTWSPNMQMIVIWSPPASKSPSAKSFVFRGCYL